MHAHIGPETDAQLSHGYSRGTVDGDILANNQGIWAAKTSLAVLLATAVVRLMIVGFTGSAALLADTIYNFGGGATAIPLGRPSPCSVDCPPNASTTATVGLRA